MKNILIFDPSDLDFQAAQGMLMYAGHKLRHCKQISELYALITESKPDLLMIEFMLAGRSFLSVMRELKSFELTADIPVISVSRDNGVNKPHALMMGAVAHLTKPYNMTELFGVIQQV